MNDLLLFGMPGGAELFFIILVVIMLFGAKKIPELARGLGKGMREIKNATGDIQREIKEGIREVNTMQDKVDLKKQVNDLMKEDEENRSTTTDEASAKEKKPTKATNTTPTSATSATVKRKNIYEKDADSQSSENL